jgi:hypothetical protein
MLSRISEMNLSPIITRWPLAALGRKAPKKELQSRTSAFLCELGGFARDAFDFDFSLILFV